MSKLKIIGNCLILSDGMGMEERYELHKGLLFITWKQLKKSI